MGDAISPSVGVTPVPLRLTVRVGMFEFVLKVSVPVATAAVVGAKVTVAVQDAEGASDAPQWLASAKPLLICTDAMESGLTVSTLVNVTVCAMEPPTPMEPKAMEAGFIEGGAMFVTVTVTLLESAPS